MRSIWVLPELLPGFHRLLKRQASIWKRCSPAPNSTPSGLSGPTRFSSAPFAAEHAFVVVQDLFLTETAKRADVLSPLCIGL